jgi:hypothetical protein
MQVEQKLKWKWSRPLIFANTPSLLEMEETKSMDRSFKRFALIFVFCLWASQAHAAKSNSTAVAPIKPPAPPVSQDRPTIEVPEMTYDFGEIMEGEEVVHEFKAKNTGKSVLNIDQVRPG